MLQNEMEKGNKTCSDFMSYLNVFRNADFTGEKNKYNDFLEDMFRPLFSNVCSTPIPPLGLFAGYPIDKKLPVTIRKVFGKTFEVK